MQQLYLDTGDYIVFNLVTTGITLGNIDVTVWKPGSGSFVTADGSTIAEISEGWYSFLATDVDADSEGNNLFRMLHNTGGAEEHIQEVFIEERLPVPPVPTTRPVLPGKNEGKKDPVPPLPTTRPVLDTL